MLERNECAVQFRAEQAFVVLGMRKAVTVFTRDSPTHLDDQVDHLIRNRTHLLHTLSSFQVYQWS